ncbi:M23 family metallopeptidase [Sansalvadorimonas sp. 2012CJ34-2]|uniref:M23 family metallopeptidase n=1 Tax=Parendozoicomonas callyspongiae TaxID=2942213 RepID=A0ABT0PEJ4_9GAMM|nr:M23 family metallopeptidase [Sansalvadorimonas sp. 2012CJ34-2]MCL6268963.1 M23 family metallopeptidase [Sansalvadorimonas sp. 2012CJ34-2]
MKIIVVRHPHGKSRTFWLNGVRLAWVACLFSASLVTAGFVAGWHYMDINSTGSMSARELENWQKELAGQRKAVEKLRNESAVELDALSVQIAQLQGQLMRLDALGERLVTMADLTGDEFDFGTPPALGGPEDSQESGTAYQPPGFSDQIDELAARIDSKAEQLEVLESMLLGRSLQDDLYIAGRPIKKGWMSSPFGRRTDPFTGRPALHQGVDFAGKEGSDVIAVGSGVVTWSGERSGYGLLVEINHGNGYVTRYAHNKEILVKVGDIVSKGQTVSHMGSSGRSTGPHVHFEVLVNGRQVNPSRYVYRASR